MLFRKVLFGSLTLMLAAVLVWLIIKGRQQEAKLAAAPNEIVKTARSSSTRIVAPQDLDVTFQQEAAAGQTPRSLGKVVIHNTGKETYHNVMLKLSFVGAGDRVLGSQNYLVKETIEPGQIFAAGEVSADNAPGGTSRCNVVILYSEFGPARG